MFSCRHKTCSSENGYSWPLLRLVRLPCVLCRNRRCTSPCSKTSGPSTCPASTSSAPSWTCCFMSVHCGPSRHACLRLPLRNPPNRSDRPSLFITCILALWPFWSLNPLSLVASLTVRAVMPCHCLCSCLSVLPWSMTCRAPRAGLFWGDLFGYNLFLLSFFARRLTALLQPTAPRRLLLLIRPKEEGKCRSPRKGPPALPFPRTPRQEPSLPKGISIRHVPLWVAVALTHHSQYC